MDAVIEIALFVVLAAVWVCLVISLDDLRPDRLDWRDDPRPDGLDWRVHRPFYDHR